MRICINRGMSNKNDIQVGDALSIMLDKEAYVTGEKHLARRTIRLYVIARRRNVSVVYVPRYIRVANACILARDVQETLKLDEKWLGEYIIAIADDLIAKIFKHPEGHNCLKCNQFFAYVTANLSKGLYTCYECRTYPRK